MGGNRKYLSNYGMVEKQRVENSINPQTFVDENEYDY